MKKTIALLLALLTFLACALAEGEANTQVNGELFKPGQSEEALNQDLKTMFGYRKVASVLYFDNLTSLLMALNSGRIDKAINLPLCVANYIAKRGEGYAITGPSFSVALQIGIRDEDEALLGRFNAAIAKLAENGALAALQTEYLENASPDSSPVPVEIPAIAGAETIRVVVTGDLPPLDYVTADGKPAGFNVALLAALSKEMGANIQLVLTDAGSRAAMLTSGRADAIFWMRKNTAKNDAGEAIAVFSEAPEGISLTESYFESETASLKLK